MPDDGGGSWAERERRRLFLQDTECEVGGGGSRRPEGEGAQTGKGHRRGRGEPSARLRREGSTQAGPEGESGQGGPFRRTGLDCTSRGGGEGQG